VSNNHRISFLNLNHLIPDREVAAAGWLPLDVARRCRALPVAQDDGVITVAMADPADHAAREEVAAALAEQAAGRAARSPQLYLVQGDGALIDAWLADLAGGDCGPGQLAPPPPQVWLREPLHGDKAAVISYAAQVAALLGAPLNRFDPLLAAQDGLDSVARDLRWEPKSALRPDAAPDGRLVILPCVDFNLPGPLPMSGDGSGPATIYACRPRWPLRRLLLIVRGDPVDDAALAWAARLAKPAASASGASATALMVAPHTPGTHGSLRVMHAPAGAAGSHSPAHDDISSLLSANSAIGHKMQHVVQRLAALQLDAVLHLRQGAPEAMIREELAAAPYDLIIAGVAVRGAEAQWRLRPLLHKLLPDLRCPLLLTGGG
jgi:hypothetical protein